MGECAERTALEAAVVVAAFAVEAVLVAPTPDLMAFVGALSIAAEGVYATVVVVAFETGGRGPRGCEGRGSSRTRTSC